VASREQMISRIRAALGRPAGRPSEMAGLGPPNLPELGQVMPLIKPEDIIPKFIAEFEKNSTKVWRANSIAEFDAVLSGLVKSSEAGSAVLSRNPLLKRLNLANRLKSLGAEPLAWPEGPVTAVAESLFRERCFTAPIGFTGVDCALAETGSLIVSSSTEGVQLASLAPPIHVAILLESQILANLEDALAAIPVWRGSAGPPSGRSVVFISGTSRTADIEQIVVRGVHGPQEVHAILIGDSYPA
jgi:L-lactate dehydrogenase complex protein LldG